MIAKFLAGLALIIGVILYFSFSWGFVLFKFWDWFIMGTFEEVPNITFNQAIGLSIFLNLFQRKMYPSFKEELYKEDLLSRVSTTIISPWLTLFIGYLIYMFFLI